MSISWLINWKSILPKKNANHAKIRCKLISDSTNNITNAWTGSLRLSLQSHTSQITNGFNIGNVFVRKDPLQTGYYYLESNTLHTDGFNFIVPTEEQSVLTITMYDLNENMLTSIPNYQVFLYFDNT
jgi:hypothetical protein